MIVVGPNIRGVVLLLIMIADAEGAREIRVPETVIGGPPGTSVWPAIMYCEAALGVMTELPMVTNGSAVGVVGPKVRGIILLLIMIADAEGAREMRVPEMVIGEAPGLSV